MGSGCIPAGACDCHTHVFGDGKDFSWWESEPVRRRPLRSTASAGSATAHALIAANEDRIVWGTTGRIPATAGRRRKSPPPIPVDDGALLNQLTVWAPDAAMRRKILVDNPARLYGF